MLKTYLTGTFVTFVAGKYICQERTEHATVMALAWPLLAFGIITQHIALGVMLAAHKGNISLGKL